MHMQILCIFVCLIGSIFSRPNDIGRALANIGKEVHRPLKVELNDEIFQAIFGLHKPVKNDFASHNLIKNRVDKRNVDEFARILPRMRSLDIPVNDEIFDSIERLHEVV